MPPTACCLPNMRASAGSICRSRSSRRASSTPSSRPRTRISTRITASIPKASCARSFANFQNRGSGKRPAGRLDDHPAGGEELPPHQRGELHPQDQGGSAGLPHRADLLEGQDPRALSQRDLSRHGQLRHRRRRAQLFRQVGERADRRRSRLSRGAAQGAEQLSSHPPARGRDRTAQLGDRPDGRERLRHQGGGREGQGRAAQRRSAPRRRRADLCRRLFHRGSAPRDRRALRREEALRRRALGPHDARSEAAAGGAQGADRRPRALRRGARLSRRHQDVSISATIGARRSPAKSASTTSSPGSSPWCSNRATTRPASACSRRSTSSAASPTTGRPAR